MKKKQLTALFMGMALAFSLTACSGFKTSDTAGNDNRSETESKNSTILDNSQADENSSEADGSQENENSSEADSSQENENSSEADGSQENDTAQADQTETSGENSGILIAYFSIPEDVDAVAGASIVVKDNQTMGNTEYVAGLIQETVGGSLFRIETKEQYPLDHDPLVDQAADEQDADARPALETHIENPDQYDTIILGCPNWWGDLPQPLYTFLEEYDFSSKTIIPFVTHGGSGFSNTQKTIAQLQPDAVVSDNTLSLSRNSVADSREDVIAWAESLGL